jgi:hypothetical protein
MSYDSQLNYVYELLMLSEQANFLLIILVFYSDVFKWIKRFQFCFALFLKASAKL